MIDRKVHSGFVRPPAEPNADDIKASVNEFLETNPVTPGASAEEAAQIKLNAENIEKLQTLSEGLDTVVISESAPNTENKCLWIQSGKYESFDIPQINDDIVSEEDTWSSKKISEHISQFSCKKMSVHVTGSGTSESPYVCDTPHSDMYDAYYNGYEITATFTGTYEGIYYIDLQFSLIKAPDPGFGFSSENVSRHIITIYIDDSDYISLFCSHLSTDQSLSMRGVPADSYATGYRLQILENTRPDWQENNQTQLNYIENRPFYEIINQEDIITQQTKTFAYSSSGYCSTHITEQKYVTSGTNCKVFWDGDIYDVISKSERYPCFGDKNFIEYPFYFLLDVSESSGEVYGYNVYSNDTSDTEHTFRIYTETSDITCIDEKFIPNSIKDYTNLQNKPILLLSSLITTEFSSTTASVDLYGLFGKQNQVISVHDDTTYKMIQLKYNSLVFCIVKSDFSIRANKFTDSQNFEIVVTNNVRNYSITVTNGEISEETSSSYVLNENVLIKGNNAEYTPTTDYSPATKKYVDDIIASVITFNDSGELVVTIDGISKTFVPS